MRVRDNGIGIEPSCCRACSSCSTQGERTLDRSQGGLGVGLTLVQRLVELHSGSVEAPARPGPGRGVPRAPALPQRGRAARSRDAGRAPAPARAGGCRVLVVDDNLDAAETHRACSCELAGHEVQDGRRRPQALGLRAGLRARRWWCSTSACRGSTATRWRAGCASCRRPRTRC